MLIAVVNVVVFVDSYASERASAVVCVCVCVCVCQCVRACRVRVCTNTLSLTYGSIKDA